MLALTAVRKGSHLGQPSAAHLTLPAAPAQQRLIAAGAGPMTFPPLRLGFPRLRARRGGPDMAPHPCCITAPHATAARPDPWAEPLCARGGSCGGGELTRRARGGVGLHHPETVAHSSGQLSAPAASRGGCAAPPHKHHHSHPPSSAPVPPTPQAAHPGGQHAVSMSYRDRSRSPYRGGSSYGGGGGSRYDSRCAPFYLRGRPTTLRLPRIAPLRCLAPHGHRPAAFARTQLRPARPSPAHYPTPRPAPRAGTMTAAAGTAAHPTAVAAAGMARTAAAAALAAGAAGATASTRRTCPARTSATCPSLRRWVVGGCQEGWCAQMVGVSSLPKLRRWVLGNALRAGGYQAIEHVIGWGECGWCTSPSLRWVWKQQSTAQGALLGLACAQWDGARPSPFSNTTAPPPPTHLHPPAHPIHPSHTFTSPTPPTHLPPSPSPPMCAELLLRAPGGAGAD